MKILNSSTNISVNNIYLLTNEKERECFKTNFMFFLIFWKDNDFRVYNMC